MLKTPLSLSLILILCTACLPVQKQTAPPLPAAQQWAHFIHSAPSKNSVPESFRVKISINYYGPERKDRFLANLWGNNDYPLRMDLMAGIGQIFSMWREDKRQWQALYPSRKILYKHDDGRVGANAVGFPTPFDLLEISRFLTGQYVRLAPENYTKCEKQGKKTTYSFPSGSKIKKMTLSMKSDPIQFTGSNWQAELSDFGSKRHIAHRIDLKLNKGQKAVIRIKELKFREEPWKPEKLELRIPPDTKTLYIFPSENNSMGKNLHING